MFHSEGHRINRVGWLRAAVLGANDGIISTSSLLIGVAAAKMPLGHILISGAAGLLAGAMSMAAGEYISVKSQADIEKSDLIQERHELETNYPHELEELTAIYISRGLTQDLAKEVAKSLMAHDALDAHARDELGINERSTARPLQAAVSSGLSFSLGAFLPLSVALIGKQSSLISLIFIMSIFFLALLGSIAAGIAGSKNG